MDLRRSALPLINATFITGALFVLMYSLIDIAEPELETPFSMPQVSFVHVQPEETLKIIVPKEIAPDLVSEKPDVPTFDPEVNLDITDEITWTPYIREPIGDGVLQFTNNQLVMALGFPPQYPNSALRREIEGYVVVGFSVDKSGSVINPFIIESEPKGVFDRSALKGISKFKYKARMVDGHPVVTDGQQYQFTYKLDNG